MATSIDDNAADEKSAKSRCQLFIIRCTRSYRRGEIDNFLFEEVNTLDIETAKSYYNQIRSEDLCDCDYCRNNIHEVEAAYPTSFIGTHPLTVSYIT